MRSQFSILCPFLKQHYNNGRQRQQKKSIVCIHRCHNRFCLNWHGIFSFLLIKNIFNIIMSYSVYWSCYHWMCTHVQFSNMLKSNLKISVFLKSLEYFVFGKVCRIYLFCMRFEKRRVIIKAIRWSC